MCPVQVLQEPLYSQKPIFVALNRQKFKMSRSATTNSKTVPLKVRRLNWALRYQCTPNLIIFQKNCVSLFQIDLIAIFHFKKILRKKIDSKQSY